MVTFPTRKALALLSYLVVEGGVQPRERITALFWPESRADLGRAALRKTLAYLRQALGEHGAADQEQPISWPTAIRCNSTPQLPASSMCGCCSPLPKRSVSRP